MDASFTIPEAVIRKQAAADNVTHFATGIAVLRDGKLLVVRRVPDDDFGGLYELPGGGVDTGETFAESAIRETFEETGLHVRAITGSFYGFDYQTRSKPKVRQINLIVEVESGDVVLEPSEHDHFLWIGPQDIDTLHTSDAMRPCLRNALASQARSR